MKLKTAIFVYAACGVVFLLCLVPALTGCFQAAELAVFRALCPAKGSFYSAFLKAITLLGNWRSAVLIAALLLAVPKRGFRLKIALPAAATALFSVALNEGLKALVARARPAVALFSERGFSFPSGHAMNNGALYFTLFLLANRYLKKGPLKTAVLCLLGLLPVLIAFSRVALGVHYLSDVLAGLAVGLALAVTAFQITVKNMGALQAAAQKKRRIKWG